MEYFLIREVSKFIVELICVFLLFSVEGISNNLANYMTMALDPNVGAMVNMMEKEYPQFHSLMESLRLELESKLSSSGISLPDLFHRIAVRCYINSILIWFEKNGLLKKHQ